MEDRLKPLAKSVLIILISTKTAPPIVATIQKKIHDSGIYLENLSYKLEDIMKIVKYFEKSGFLIKDVSEKNKNEVKKQKGGFLSMLLDIFDGSLLGNLLTG